MDGRRTLASAIESALPTVASVLCGMISEYAYERPHTWRTDGFDRSTQIEFGADGSIRHTDRDSSVWSKVVSSTSVRDGRQTWSIRTNRQESVGIGVTVDRSNADQTIRRFAARNTWTFAFMPTSIDKYHNGKSVGQHPFRSNETVITIRFAADPSTRQVTAVFDGHSCQVDLLTAISDDDFALLRPCVLLSGNVTLQMTSGP